MSSSLVNWVYTALNNFYGGISYIVAFEFTLHNYLLLKNYYGKNSLNSLKIFTDSFLKEGKFALDSFLEIPIIGSSENECQEILSSEYSLVIKRKSRSLKITTRMPRFLDALINIAYIYDCSVELNTPYQDDGMYIQFHNLDTSVQIFSEPTFSLTDFTHDYQINLDEKTLLYTDNREYVEVLYGLVENKLIPDIKGILYMGENSR